MRILSLFAGIGGFDLAARWMGWQTVAFCEKEPFCQKVLTKNFPGVPIHDDIHTLKGDQYGPVDLICGGFPCQPWSVAGQQRGSEDDRHLWPEMLRIIHESRPRWVVGENVAGIIKLGLDGVLADLEAEGYACQSFVIPACAVNARHRRDRVWVVAYTDTERRSIKQLSPSGRIESIRRGSQNVSDAQGVGSQSNTKPDGCYQMPGSWGESEFARVYGDQASANTDSLRLQKQQFSTRDADMGSDRVWQSLPDPASERSARPAEPGVCGDIDGVPAWMDSHLTGPGYKARIKALGNAVVPQVVYEIFKAIEAVDTHQTIEEGEKCEHPDRHQLDIALP